MPKVFTILSILFFTLIFVPKIQFPPLQKPPISQQIKKPQSIKLKTPPTAKTLKNDYFISQSFNNCGPASLSMLFSYFNVKVSQEELGRQLRPYQNTSGDNDDKSVTMQELADKAEEYDLTAYHRPDGNINQIKQFINYNIPVLTRTWLDLDDDIGHYRIIKGYDDENKIIIQDDSYQGQNLTFSYDDFNTLWSKYNFEYLVITPKDKKDTISAILGKNINEKIAWETTLDKNEKALKNNPDDIYIKFNIAIASYYLKDYKKTVNEYEKIADNLPFRTLWYQKEPIDAYFKLGKYDKVLSLTNSVLNNNNKAFSELYILRGKIFQQQGKIDQAKTEFENAVYYNNQLKAAEIALTSLEKQSSSKM